MRKGSNPLSPASHLASEKPLNTSIVTICNENFVTDSPKSVTKQSPVNTNENQNSGMTSKQEFELFKTLKQDLTPGSLRFYNQKISPFISDYPDLNTVRDTDIKNWIASRKTLNKRTGELERTNNQLTYYRAIRSLFNWREEYFNIDYNPFNKMKPPKKEKKIMPALRKNQIEIAINTANNVRDKTIIALFAESGMRLAELTNIEYENVDLDSMNIRVLGKGRKWRYVPIGDLSRAYLREYFKEYGVKGGLIWKTKNTGENITYQTIRKMLDALSKKTGFHMNPHQFRRGFVVMLKEQGVPITDIKEYGGWTDLAMPELYGKTYEYEQARKHYKAPLAGLNVGLPSLNS